MEFLIQYFWLFLFLMKLLMQKNQYILVILKNHYMSTLHLHDYPLIPLLIIHRVNTHLNISLLVSSQDM